mgnify:FL=1
MGWWFSQADSSYAAQDYTDCCKGYKESVELVEKVFKEEVSYVLFSSPFSKSLL